MTDEERERQAKAVGESWAKKDLDVLLGEITVSHAPPTAQTQAMIEVTRRQILAIRDFNRASGRQATAMIWLTVLIAVLTAAMLALVWLQLEAAR